MIDSNIFYIFFIIVISLILILDQYYHQNNIIVNPINKYSNIILSISPKITYINNFITPEEADYFISYIDNYKEPSLVHIYEENIVRADVRTSYTAYINPINIHCINVKNRVAQYFKSDVKRLSQLQGNLYEKDQFYKPHYDFFIPRTEEDYKNIDNNRSKTLIMYLTDIPKEADGCTSFPNINLKVQPKRLDALYFENIKNGKFDYNTLHAGEPIIGNYKKYICNIWDR
jgi:prolyl 4-hydroxylase